MGQMGSAAATAGHNMSSAMAIFDTIRIRTSSIDGCGEQWSSIDAVEIPLRSLRGARLR
jgi:hypothetical protein